ncbi:MAG: kelch repeat-containing protein [Gemmatimonadota bacterium]
MLSSAPRYPGTTVLTRLALVALIVGCAPENRDPEPAPEEAESLWVAGPTLPQPISNNAVAAVEIDGEVSVFTFLGIDSTKVWSGVTNVAYRWDVGSDSWRAIDPVPGPGRLAPTVQVLDGLIYVIGGYTVAEDGSEQSLPDVAIYDPRTDEWSRGADIPVPTDDAVSGIWRAQDIVLVSGWHNDGNIADVQLYDPSTDRWRASTPIPGAPVFGHTGTVVGDYIAYVDGAAVVDARPRFQLDTASWRGTLDATDGSIAWEAARPHPGPPLYRSAAAVLGSYALFIGGTDNPYNYSGVGYDGVPADPLHQLLAYSPELDLWDQLTPPPEATMDHRTAGVAGGRIYLVGGMVAGQRVSDRVWWADVVDLLGAPSP